MTIQDLLNQFSSIQVDSADIATIAAELDNNSINLVMMMME